MLGFFVFVVIMISLVYSLFSSADAAFLVKQQLVIV